MPVKSLDAIFPGRLP